MESGGGGWGGRKVSTNLLQIYNDTFDLERGFRAAQAETVIGAADFGVSDDDEQTKQVSGLVRGMGIFPEPERRKRRH